MSLGAMTGAKPAATAGMTPSAGGKTLPGAKPGVAAQNQLQQALMPAGAGAVAPQQQNIAFENRAQNQRGMLGVNQQATGGLMPVAPTGLGGAGSTFGANQLAQQQAQIRQRNVARSSMFGR